MLHASHCCEKVLTDWHGVKTGYGVVLAASPLSPQNARVCMRMGQTREQTTQLPLHEIEIVSLPLAKARLAER